MEYLSFVHNLITDFCRKYISDDANIKIIHHPHTTSFSISIRNIEYNEQFMDMLNKELEDFLYENQDNYDVEVALFNRLLLLYEEDNSISGDIDIKNIIELTEKRKLKDIKKPNDVSFILQMLNDKHYSEFVVGVCVIDV